MMLGSVTFRDLVRDCCFVEFRQVEPDRECLELLLQFLRGHRSHNGRIDSTTEKTGDWDVSEKMFFHGLIDPNSHLPENVVRRRSKYFARWPISPRPDLSLTRDCHGMAGGQDEEFRVKKISFGASAPLQIT